jgi:hypothetical protein
MRLGQEQERKTLTYHMKIVNMMPKSKSKTEGANLQERSHNSFYYEVVSIFISGLFGAILGVTLSKGTLTFVLLIELIIGLVIIPLAVAKGLTKILRI